MKTIINYLVMIGLFATSIVSAQVPQAFSYQAVIRDTTGMVFQDKLISLRISILKGDAQGEAVYSEIHDVWTDKFGLVNLNIGEGLDVTRDFSEIPWGENSFFLQIEMDMDGAMNYRLLGTTQLMSVPYALYAENSGNKIWSKTENGIYYDEDRVGIGTNNPKSRLDVNGSAHFRSNTTFGSGNWIGLYLNGYGNDDQAEWLISSHNQGGLQLRRWDGVDWSEHYLKVDEGKFRFGAYDCPPLLYHFNGWASITDSLKVGKVLAVNDQFRITEDGKVGIGTTDPGTYKFRVEIDEDGGSERAIALFKNNSTATGSLCNLYISAGESGSTYLNFISSNYIHQGGKYKSHTMLGNNGKGLVFRTGQNDEGRVAFEFRRETSNSYTYDEKVSITYDGNMGIGTTNPQRKLHINNVMRLEPRYTAPNNPTEGDIYMDSNDHVLKVYNGTEWKSCW